MISIYRDAIIKAGEIRRLLGVSMFQPINIFDSCIKMGIDVKFVDINMEGLYIKQNETSTILISNLRPLPRRCFTCGHELGHHVFNHGLKVDVLSEENKPNYKDKDEILVDAFSAALLMPVGGIQAEFIKRNLDIKFAGPVDFYIISSIFGVGYQTLVTHCMVNNLITDYQATSLLKLTPAKIFKNVFGNINDKSYFRIFDQQVNLSVVDLEVSNYLILPQDFQIESSYLEKIMDTRLGILYKAIKVGISSAHSHDGGSSFFIRIQKGDYIGFAEYRHFEN